MDDDVFGQLTRPHDWTCVVLDHVVYLTDQVRRLRYLLISQGIRVPDDLGTLGSPSEEAFDRLTEEWLRVAADRRRANGEGR